MAAPDRLPPHSPEIEKHLLGLVVAGEIEPSLVTKHPPEIFYDPANRTIITAIGELDKKGQKIDTGVLHDYLRDTHRLDEIGGVEKIAHLVASPGIKDHADQYLDDLRTKLMAREAIKISHDFIGRMMEEPHLAGTVLGIAAESFDYARRLLPTSKNGKLTIRRPEELLTMKFPETDNMLGDRMLAEGQSLVIAGAGGIGKSRLALQLAVCTILHREFVGLETHGMKKKWMILQAENHNRRLAFDLKHLKQWAGDEWARVDRQMVIHTLETDSDGFLSLDSEDTLNHLSDCIQDHNPDVIVWDSLYNFSRGDLNSDADMRDTLLCLGRLTRAGNVNRACAVLHHALTGRAGSMKVMGFDRSSFGRNSKVLYNWCRAQINLAPGTEDENTTLVVSCGKCSNGREFKPFAVTLNPDTMLYEIDADFDLAQWSSDLTGKSAPIMGPERVSELCGRPMDKSELAKAVMADCGCSKATAYRHVQKAGSLKYIKINPETSVCTSARSKRP